MAINSFLLSNLVKILVAMQKMGQPRPVCDSQIAATALANNMILVARNTRDFLPIQKISLLKLENWFEPEIL